MRIDQAIPPLQLASEPCQVRESLDREQGSESEFSSLIGQLKNEDERSQPVFHETLSPCDSKPKSLSDLAKVINHLLTEESLTLAMTASELGSTQSLNNETLGDSNSSAAQQSPQGCQGSAAAVALLPVSQDSGWLRTASGRFAQIADLAMTLAAGECADVSPIPAPGSQEETLKANPTEPDEKSGEQATGRQTPCVLDPPVIVTPMPLVELNPVQPTLVAAAVSDRAMAEPISVDETRYVPPQPAETQAVAAQDSPASDQALSSAVIAKGPSQPISDTGVFADFEVSCPESPVTPLPAFAPNTNDSGSSGASLRWSATPIPPSTGLKDTKVDPIAPNAIRLPTPAPVISALPPYFGLSDSNLDFYAQNAVRLQSLTLTNPSASVTSVSPDLPAVLASPSAAQTTSLWADGSEQPRPPDHKVGLIDSANALSSERGRPSAANVAPLRSVANAIRGALAGEPALQEQLSEALFIIPPDGAVPDGTSVDEEHTQGFEAALQIRGGERIPPQLDQVKQAFNAEQAKGTSPAQTDADASTKRGVSPKSIPVSTASPQVEKRPEPQPGRTAASPEPESAQKDSTPDTNEAAMQRPKTTGQRESTNAWDQAISRGRAGGSIDTGNATKEAAAGKEWPRENGPALKELVLAGAISGRFPRAVSNEHQPLSAASAVPGGISEAKTSDILRPTPPVPAGSSAEFLRELADRIQMQIQDGGSALRIRLKPESLGHIEIRAENAASGVIARIATESGDVKNYLEHNLHTLQQNLQSQGVKVEKIEIVVQDGFDARHSAQSDSAGHQGSGQPGNGPSESSGVSVSRHSESLDELVLDATAVRELGPNSTFHTIA